MGRGGFAAIIASSNDRTELIKWSLLDIGEIIAQTGGCDIFSTVDLLIGHWQQPLTAEARKPPALVALLGAFEYNPLNVNPFDWKCLNNVELDLSSQIVFLGKVSMGRRQQLVSLQQRSR